MLMRTDPFRDFDRLTEAVFGSAARPAVMPMTAYRDDGTFVVHLDVPGVAPDSIDLTIEQNVLKVHAERKPPLGESAEKVVEERVITDDELDGRETILVVDDESAIRRFLQTVLKAEEFSLHLAETGHAGLAAAAAVRPPKGMDAGRFVNRDREFRRLVDASPDRDRSTWQDSAGGRAEVATCCP